VKFNWSRENDQKSSMNIEYIIIDDEWHVNVKLEYKTTTENPCAQVIHKKIIILIQSEILYTCIQLCYIL